VNEFVATADIDSSGNRLSRGLIGLIVAKVSVESANVEVERAVSIDITPGRGMSLNAVNMLVQS